MAVRTTAAEVQAIIETSLTETQIDAIIVSSNVYVTARLGSTTLSDEVLKEIERWMTAHMIASGKERQAEQEEAGPAKIKYAGKTGLGLQSTSYGQMCLSLDTTGELAKESRRPISIQALSSLEENE